MNKKFIIYIVSFAIFFANNSYANVALIRDAETERFLYNLSTPIFKAANLDVKNIKIFIVNDDSINAFVSGGQNVFINTGLILKYKTPDALIGVIAHETGHIAAGHLARSSEEIKKAEGAMLLTYLLGIGAALSGSPDAAQGLLLGGSQSAERLFMKFTRQQEEAADQHAIQYLDKISYPATGLVNLLEFFEQEMIGYKNQIDEYSLSHPVSQKRIDLIKARTKNKNFSDEALNKKLQPSMNWVLAKLEGFIENPQHTLEIYKNRNDEFSNYKKSVALYRQGRYSEALKLLDPLIEKNKRNGFLYEVKGQILFDSGNIEDSILAYNEAIKNIKNEDSALIKISLATSILSLKSKDQDLINLAIKNLKEAQIFEDENPFLFKQLANAYDKLNEKGRSNLFYAEYYLLINDKEKANKSANSAKESLPKSAKQELLRADDIIEASKDKKEK